MGGNRKGKLRTYFNLFMTMLLGGLWHGASWKFVLWGAMHGSVLAIEKAFRIPKLTNKNVALKLMAGILTFHFVAFCWIFFRASDFANALNVIGNIGMLEWSPQNWWSVIAGYQNVAIVMLIGFIWHFIPQNWQDQQLLFFHRIPVVGKVVLFAVTIWIISATASSEVQPFIYFQF